MSIVDDFVDHGGAAGGVREIANGKVVRPLAVADRAR